MKVELVVGVVLIESVQICDILAVSVGICKSKLGLLFFVPKKMLKDNLELASLSHD